MAAWAEAATLLVLAAGILALAWARGRWKNAHPFQMTYHETGIPHQRGMIVMVHYETKRFATLDAALDHGAQLLAKGYAEVHVVREFTAERAGFSAEVVPEDLLVQGRRRYRVQVTGPLGLGYDEVVRRLWPGQTTTPL